MGLDERVFFKLEGIPHLLDVKILVFENLPIEKFKDLNFPNTLPNLKTLEIQGCPLKSLEGLPQYLPNLESISIVNSPELISLEGLPFYLPKLCRITLKSLPKLHSLKGIPPDLPWLYCLDLQDVNLFTFKHLPENLTNRFSLTSRNEKPKDLVIFDLNIKGPFKGFDIEDYIIKDFSFLDNFTVDDIKNMEFIFNRCIINSFEGFLVLPKNINPKEIFYMLEENYNQESCLFHFGNSKIRSFSGLSLPNLRYLLPFLIYTENFDFAPAGRKLYEECINRSAFQKENWSAESFDEFFNCKDPIDSRIRVKYNISLEEMAEYNVSNLGDWKIEKEKEYWKTKEQWFYQSKIAKLYEYFKTPLIDLAHQYISDITILPPAQIERLIHEADHNIRKILENSLPPKNPVLLQISQKIAFKAPNGLKILK